jgi:hypothetical protein
VQFAGLFNVTRAGNSDINSFNLQFAGLFNHTRRGISVIQHAGIFNTGDTAYLQAAGLFNVAKKVGVQASGLFNVSQETYVQLAGLFNHGNVAHFQAAGLWNTAKQTKCQIAGIANVAEESSCQISGIVNVTKKGRFQMGLINVRDTADGVSLGLINIVKKGGILEAGIEVGEFVHTAATFRSGVQCLYSIISVGYNYTDNFWSVGAGLGTSIKLKGNLSLNLELRQSTLYNNLMNYTNQWCTLAQFSPVLNYRFAKHFKMYVGPSFNFLFYTIKDAYLDGVGIPQVVYGMKIPYAIFNARFNSIATDYRGVVMWIGVVGGIKF